jgi:hypothetical protein
MSYYQESAGGTGALSINSTPISGATGAILWDDAGTLQEVVIGPGLSFAGGTLSATSAPITINTTPIIGGTSPLILYDNAGTVGEMSHFANMSGNPNVTSGAYYAGGRPALYMVPNISNNNWFEGDAGNFTVTGNANFATGERALSSLTTGANNTAMGVNALVALTDGTNNFGFGTGALGQSVHDGANVAMGFGAGGACNGGSNNTLLGSSAGSAISTGAHNVCIGESSGSGITTGFQNICIGAGSGASVAGGIDNIVIGTSCDVALPGTLGAMSIGNFIYGTGITGTGSTISTGWIGIGVKAAYGSEALGVNGTVTTNSATFMSRTATAYNNGAGASTATFTNAPLAGNPTKWIPVDDNGTTRYVPAF